MRAAWMEKSAMNGVAQRVVVVGGAGEYGDTGSDGLSRGCGDQHPRKARSAGRAVGLVYAWAAEGPQRV